MLHNGRSGSTLLGNMLDQHEEIFWDGETFEKKLHKKSARSGIGFAELWGEIGEQSAFDDLKKRMRQRAAGRIFGTELQDYHTRMMGSSIESYLDRLRHLGFTKFVFLERNYLRKIVSHVIATEKRSFHVAANKRAAPARIHLNPDRLYIGHRHTTLLDVMREYQEFRQRTIEHLKQDNVLFLSYEHDIEGDPQAATSKIFKYIGVRPIRPEVTLGKTTDRDLHSVVENFDEVLEFVSKSEFSEQIKPFKASARPSSQQGGS